MVLVKRSLKVSWAGENQFLRRIELELRAFARAGRSKELVEIELVELPGARNRQQLIRHLVRQQPYLRQRSVGVPLAGVLDGELLLATLFVGVRPVEDLLFNELVLSFANWNDQLTSSPKLKGHAEELLTVSNEHGFPWFSNLALISDGPRAGDASCAESAFALRKFILRGAAARLGFDPVRGTVRKTVCAKERPWQRRPILGFQAALRSTR